MAKTGRNGVELADVEAAVAELLAEDRRPTLRSVRERLGRGSMGTIQRHLADLQKRAESAIPHEPLPGAITEAIFAFANERAARIEAQLAQHRADAEETIRTLSYANDQSAIELEAEKLRCTEIQQRSDVLAGRIVELEEALRVTREEVRHHASVREAAEVRIARLEVQLERLPQAEAALVDLQSRIRENETVIGEARAEIATATAELAASRKTSQHYRDGTDALQADLSRALAAMDQLSRKLASVETENAKLTSMLERRLGQSEQHIPPTTRPKKSRDPVA